MKLTIRFEPRDLWIGVYWDRGRGWWRVYVCLVPCLPLCWGWGVRGDD